LNFLQRPEAQEHNMADLSRKGVDAEQVRAQFLEALNTHNFRLTKEYQAYIDNLHEGLKARAPVLLSEVLEGNSQFIKPFLNRVDDKFKLIIHVYPAAGLWEKQATRELTQSILDTVDNANAEIYVTGIQTISDELKRLMRTSFEVSTGLSVLLVFGILYLHFRKWRLVWLTLVPLLVSVVWMLGTMHMLGIDITILNFVATPLIIGIGIDDGVHIVEKYLHRTAIAMESLMASCGKAVTLTSLTTICGFSSLFLAEYSGFRSLGLCAILGVFFCWLGAVLVLPLLLDHFRLDFVRQKDPRQH
jgi:predicted RND superfamily exporter protein